MKAFDLTRQSVWPRHRLISWLLLLVSAVNAGGCSSFSRDFEAAGSCNAAPASAMATVFGPWEGEWVSHGGHRGRLRCLLDSGDSGSTDATRPATYAARFEATFFKIFTAHYTVQLAATPTGATTQPTDGSVILNGEHDLGGLAGGVYHYEANVTPGRFDATYRSRADAGEFHMSRPSARP